LIAITTGGKLAKLSQKAGMPLWQHTYHSQPRAAVGYSAILFLALLTRLGLIPDPTKDLEQTVAAMVSQQERLKASVPTVQNPAKRMAGQLYGRWVTIFGADVLEPVARRWKSQINEIAKSWGQFEALPEADHNTLAGIVNGEEVLSRIMALFLRANCYSPPTMQRTNLTKKALMLEGLNTDFIDAIGPNRLAQQWTALHFGDYTAYYLAMAYGIDPTPVAAIEAFKQEMVKKGEED
jgi:glucose/mannose-6-phosphate isomerase